MCVFKKNKHYMSKRNISAFALIIGGALTIGGLSVVSAHGGGFFKNLTSGEGKEIMLEKKAEFFGLSVDELKTKISDGQNLRTIADEQGITQEQMFQHKLDTKKELIQALVQEGTLTQEQADQKIERMEKWHANFDGEDFHFGKKGFRHHGHRWFGAQPEVET